jgi:hypothetical protein
MKLLPLLCVLVIAHELLGAEDLSNATLVVYNPTYPESKSLAEYYAARRGLPKDRLTALPCSNDEEIDRYDYDREMADYPGDNPMEEDLNRRQQRKRRSDRNRIFGIIVQQIPSARVPLAG